MEKKEEIIIYYNLDDLKSENVKIKYDTQKQIIKLSESKPDDLYGDFDCFVDLLKNENNIMVWTGIIVLGNLSKVDNDNKIDKILPLLIKKLDTGKMITANNTIKALIEIAKNKPNTANQLALEILKAKSYKYDTDECSNIVIGNILKYIGEIWILLSDENKEKFIALAKKELSNSRPATAKKAELFLKKYCR